jgi:hypothetical protein
MVIVKATEDSENGTMPSEQMLNEMGRYNEELVNAGIMQAGEGLHPTSKGVRVHFAGTSRNVVKGPFPNINDQIAGFWLWKVKSMDEAIEWAKRCPNPMPGESDLEIRQIFELEDFGDAATPEVREREERLRAQVESQG